MLAEAIHQWRQQKEGVRSVGLSKLSPATNKSERESASWLETSTVGLDRAGKTAGQKRDLDEKSTRENVRISSRNFKSICSR